MLNLMFEGHLISDWNYAYDIFRSTIYETFNETKPNRHTCHYIATETKYNFIPYKNNFAMYSNKHKRSRQLYSLLLFFINIYAKKRLTCYIKK